MSPEVICRIAFSKRLGLVTGQQPEGGKDYLALADALQRFLGNAGRVGRCVLYVYTFMHMYLYMYVYIYVHIYVHIYIYIYMYVYIYVHY